MSFPKSVQVCLSLCVAVSWQVCFDQCVGRGWSSVGWSWPWRAHTERPAVTGTVDSPVSARLVGWSVAKTLPAS